MDKIKKEQADDLRYMLPLNKAAKRALKKFHELEEARFQGYRTLQEPDIHHNPEIHTPTVANKKIITAYVHKGDAFLGFSRRPPLWLYLSDFILSKYDMHGKASFDIENPNNPLSYTSSLEYLSTTTIKINEDFIPIAVRSINSATVETYETQESQTNMNCYSYNEPKPFPQYVEDLRIKTVPRY